MRAISVVPSAKVGPIAPDDLLWRHSPTPVPAPGQVLIQVSAAGINRADLLQRQGLYPPPPGASEVLGLECSGTVVDAGAGINTSLVGKTVCALLEGGGYAEYCVANADLALPIPETLSAVVAAALPEALATSWLNLFSIGQLKAGEVVLIQGGSSGIGTTAIQLARAAGSRVIATASSAAKREACVALGADDVLDYRIEDLAEAVMELTNGAGVHVVLDNVGPSKLDLYAPLLAPGGQIVIVGTQGGRTGSFNAGPLMAKQARIHTTSLRRTPALQKRALVRSLRSDVWPLISDGGFLPVVDSVFSFTDAASSHARVEEGGHIGKVILATNEPTAAELRGAHPISKVLQ